MPKPTNSSDTPKREQDRLSDDDLNAVAGGRGRQALNDRVTDKVVQGAGSVLSGSQVLGAG